MLNRRKKMIIINEQNIVLHKEAQKVLEQAVQAGWEEAYISLEPGQKWPRFSLWGLDLNLGIRTAPGYVVQTMYGYADIKYNHPVLSPEKIAAFQKLIEG